MPTYQYACTECGHDFEQVQSFSEDSLTVCPQCQGRLRKVYNAVGVVFKGSGFYRTDSRSDSGSSDKSGSAESGSSSDGGSKDSGSGGESGSKGSGSGDAGSSGKESTKDAGTGSKPAKESGTKTTSGGTSTSSSKTSASGS